MHLFPAQVLLGPCPLCGSAILFFCSKAFYSREKSSPCMGFSSSSVHSSKVAVCCELQPPTLGLEELEGRTVHGVLDC